MLPVDCYNHILSYDKKYKENWRLQCNFLFIIEVYLIKSNLHHMIAVTYLSFF